MVIAASVFAAVHILVSIAAVVAQVQRIGWRRKKIVHLPFILAIIGILGGAFFSVLTVMCAMDGQWPFLFFGAMVLVCDCMITAYLNCVIRYDDQGFLARNFFGIKRRCKYEEVEGLRSGRDWKVYFKGHSITIDEKSCGDHDFMVALHRGYKRATGKRLPVSSKLRRGWDPMNGHLDHPWGYFILWIVLGLFCAALPFFMLFVMTTETDPSEVAFYDVQFSNYEVDGETLRLYVEGVELPYEIDYYRDYGEVLPTPETLCSGGTYRVGVTKGHRNVKSLTGEQGRSHITFETERQVYRDNQRVPAWILAIAGVVGVYFSYMGIAVARDPERYSKWVQRLFYRDGYLH